MTFGSPAPASGRNRYADLLRVVAIGGVIYGHWLLVSVTYANGQLSGADALDYIVWGRWVTWLFQVMPVFFLVGGYANAQSWTAHHARGETWTQWVRDRVLRLMWPTAVYLVAGEVAVLVARAAGAPAGEVAEAGWLSAIQLWFLPAYMVLIALTPVLLAAHRRWGLAVPAVMALAAGLVDLAGRADPRLHAIGYLNYVFVWGCIHQWGFAWRDRTLTSPWRLCGLAAGGAALLAGLLAARAFNVDMVGSGNTNPPSIALLAFAAVQSGLVLAAEPQASGLLSGERPRRWIRRLNAQVMNAYLWHFVPVIVIVVAFYPTGVLPQPAVGSAQWWELRLAWWALLTVVLVPLVAGVTLAERPMLRLPSGSGGRARGRPCCCSRESPAPGRACPSWPSAASWPAVACRSSPWPCARSASSWPCSPAVPSAGTPGGAGLVLSAVLSVALSAFRSGQGDGVDHAAAAPVARGVGEPLPENLGDLAGEARRTRRR